MKHPFTQLMFAVGTLVIAAVAYGIWYGTVVSASARDATLAAQISDESDAAARAAAAERSLAALGPQEAAIDGHFVATTDIVSFLEKLQEAASAVGASANVGSVSEGDSPRPHLTIAMTVTGSFDAVMRALGVIEYGPYDIETTQASLTSSSNSNGGATWTASLSLSVGTRAGASGTAAPAFVGSSVAPSAPPASATSAAMQSPSPVTPVSGSAPPAPRSGTPAAHPSL